MSKKTSFLFKCASKIAATHVNTDSYVVVLPSKRAKTFLMEEFATAYNQPIYIPEIVTIDEFIRKHTKESILDKTRQLFVLFNLAKSIPKHQDLLFEEFLTWGPIVLSDFDEINRYLVDANQVFQNLISIKELESWQIGDDKQLSQSQLKFMDFWDSLPQLFSLFESYLNDNNLTTNGLALKRLSEKIKIVFSDERPHYFIGFNALSLAELNVIKSLILRKQGCFWINSDDYYFRNTKHEAGSFLRKNLEFLGIKDPDFSLDKIATEEKRITVIECAQTTGQVKVLATELLKYDPKSSKRTLVLLADETLVSSVLKNLPSQIEKANVTLGLPINQTALKGWVDLIFSIQENKERFKTKAAYFRDLIHFTHHVFSTISLTNIDLKKLSEWELDMIHQNRVFQNISQLNFPKSLLDIIEELYKPWDQDYLGAIKSIRKINSHLISNLAGGHDFEQQIVIKFDEALLSFEALLMEGIPPMNRRTFKMLFNQHISMTSIAFHGNPTNGIQIMGLLETRLLDFDCIYVLGMNEGNLPTTNILESIIPMDLRKAFGLPTPREKQGLIAHHFYSLFHSAKEITLTYATGADKFKQSEISRYLIQIELELKRKNPKLLFEKKYYTTAFPSAEDLSSTSIEKNDQIVLQLNRYFSKSISATSMNAYLKCPLDFYYKYLAELGEEENVEEELEGNRMGSFIHKTLEVLYEPFALLDSFGESKPIAPPALAISDIDNMLSQYQEILKGIFLDYLNGDITLLESGRNWLTYTVALDLVKNTLKNDRDYLKNLTEPLYIYQIEAKYDSVLDITLNNEKKQIHLKGVIDRIDLIGDNYRLLDYKSGKVKSEDVNYVKKESVLYSFQKPKHVLQLAFYAFLFIKNKGIVPDEIGIYALLERSNPIYNLNVKRNAMPEFLDEFKNLIQTVVTDAYDLDVPFEHIIDAKYCAYCS